LEIGVAIRGRGFLQPVRQKFQIQVFGQIAHASTGYRIPGEMQTYSISHISQERKMAEFVVAQAGVRPYPVAPNQ
jgi:hypothetical protein